MITAIFLIVSLLILTPVLLLLPIGFPKKWKLVLIGVAFLLANVGLMANMQLPIYQTILIIFLLCFLITLLIEKRIVNVTQTKVDSKPIEKKIISIEKETLHREDEKPNIVIEKEALPTVLNEVAAASEIPQEEDDLMEQENSLYEEDEASEEIQIVAQKIFDTETPVDPLDLDEDVSFLENRVATITTNGDVSSTKHQENNSENAYMSEIEKLLEENDIGYEETEEMPKTIDHVPQPVMEELEEIVFTKELQIEEDNEEKTDLDEEIEIEELVFHK
ncbi:hypothetical protein V7122_07305 [Bacillus sp. JJ1532]|uniref:hypothetical protein n=1 Tax=unclassified Bacillus (in: firmicutes) TaxID=185979 RepID=UPI002FFD7E53